MIGIFCEEHVGGGIVGKNHKIFMWSWEFLEGLEQRDLVSVELSWDAFVGRLSQDSIS